jgi:hypothetical protein
MLKVINQNTKYLQDTNTGQNTTEEQFFGLQQKDNCTENYLRGQAKVYATSAEAGSVGVIHLKRIYNF